METQPTALLMMGVALLLSVANLAVAFGRSRVKKADVDTQALEVTVNLAARTPKLEEQLRQTIAELHEARADVKINREKIAQLNLTISLQSEEIGLLRRDNKQLAGELEALKSMIQAVRLLGEQETKG